VTKQRFHIVCAEEYGPTALGHLRAVGDVTVLKSCDDASLKDAVGECDALMVRSNARVTREILAAAKRLRVVGRGGVGLDNIDVQAAGDMGVTVVHTPFAATEAVADLTVGLMIALLRGIPSSDTMIRAGRFAEARAGSVGRELSKLTLGIVGMGRIGRAVATRCRNGFNMKVLYNDIVDPGELPIEAIPVDKAALYHESDVVSLHVPLTAETRYLISDTALAAFRSGATLINTARGAVVDSGALVRALANASIGGAALDVTDPEPLPPGHPLLTADRVILTPHLGARTHGALERMDAVVDDVIAVLAGRRPRHAAVV